MNRRTFLGAAVAATILPAGEAVTAPAIPPGMTVRVFDTPEGALCEVTDARRRTGVVPCFSRMTPESRKLARSGFGIWSGPRQKGGAGETMRSATYVDLPSLSEVLAFHEQCIAEDARL